MPRTATTKFALTVPMLLVYAGILHWTYEVEIAPVFAYLGARYRQPDPLNYFTVFIAITLVAAMLPRQIRLPSDFILWVLFIVVVFPSALVPQYAFIVSEAEAFKIGLVVSAVFAGVIFLASRGPTIRNIRPEVPESIVWLGIIVFTLLVYAYLGATSGLALVAFDLNEVRDLRFAYRDQIDTSGTLLAFLVSFQGKVINPLLVARGTLRGQWWLVVVGTVGQLLLFSATGFKILFLSAPAILALGLVYRHRSVITGRLLVMGIVASCFLAILVDKLRGGPILWIEILIDRLLLIPGMLTAAYVGVYSDRPKHNWAYSIINPFSDDPYNGVTPAAFVGRAFTGNSAVNANASLFGDGYANAGYLGIVIEALVLVLVLWGVNFAGEHVPISVAALVLLLPTLGLANVSPLTSITTGGLAFAMLVLFVLPSHGWSRKPPDTQSQRRQHETAAYL